MSQGNVVSGNLPTNVSEAQPDMQAIMMSLMTQLRYIINRSGHLFHDENYL